MLIKIKQFLINIGEKLISPKQIDEDKKRQELILNIILIFATSGFLILNVIRVIDFIVNPADRGMSLEATLFIMIFFMALLKLNHAGWYKTAASLTIGIFALPMFYSFLTWGADLPAALLLAVLVITLSGILLGIRMAFLSTFLIATSLIAITELQNRNIIIVKNYWRVESNDSADMIVYSILLIIITTIVWLFIREIKHSLKRARLSEALLREERDSLEIKVEIRTQELLALETEKMEQLYRLAEFGRLSSGIFHDLINPLTAVALNLEQIKTETDNKIVSAKSYLSQALLATNKMEGLISSIKKQIARENSISLFSLNKEIEQTIQILSYKIRRAQVNLNFKAEEEITLEGDAVKFSQIITNLLANAIEACEETDTREIKLSLEKLSSEIRITIIDSGHGIAPENLTKIFAPFFSTKKTSGRGLGIGLAMTKDIIEKNFSGNISVTSELNHGTIFIINFPK